MSEFEHAYKLFQILNDSVKFQKLSAAQLNLKESIKK